LLLLFFVLSFGYWGDFISPLLSFVCRSSS
jgi:hypothetical protein